MLNNPYGVVTLNDVVIATALVKSPLIGEATATPAVMVGDVADEHGTHSVQKILSVTGHVHSHPLR